MSKDLQTLRKKKILIVEDDEVVADLEREILEGEEFDVEIARDGVEGLEKIKQDGYDAIISDFEMPGMKGDELYLEVKKLSQNLERKIIFVSGSINDFIKSTGNKFLEKPFSSKEIIQAVKEILHHPSSHRLP